jgi:transposase
MNSDEYRTALNELGLSQQQAAKFLGVNAVTARKWAAKKGRVTKAGDVIPPGPPETVARYLKHLVALKRVTKSCDAIPPGPPETIVRYLKHLIALKRMLP